MKQKHKNLMNMWNDIISENNYISKLNENKSNSWEMKLYYFWISIGPNCKVLWWISNVNKYLNISLNHLWEIIYDTPRKIFKQIFRKFVGVVVVGMKYKSRIYILKLILFINLHTWINILFPLKFIIIFLVVIKIYFNFIISVDTIK